jgi:hypothetical protein
MQLEKYSIGVGDRFGHQGKAQLSALVKAKLNGVDIVPVWNKSKREHTLIGSLPLSVKDEAVNAVKELRWKDSYYVDADHIGIKTVDDFIEHSNFFTLDVADFINQPFNQDDFENFIKKAGEFLGELVIPDVSKTYIVTKESVGEIASRFLTAIKEAGKIYKHIEAVKGKDNFVTEVSLDEYHQAQSPEELFFILLGLSMEGVPVQTIAPKFSGRFNKGVDYVGNVDQFAREFEDDVAVIKHAVRLFSLPENLKLSVHSGSDKFSIYKPISRIIKKYNAGIHLKTAGTTWLEELIGLAEAGGEGLQIAKEVYEASVARIDELMKPYLTVVDIDVKKLPFVEDVKNWSATDFTSALRHDQSNPRFNIHFRQLLHLGYKIAAEMGNRYISALEKYDEIIGKNVSENIFDRHIKPLFLDSK